MNRAALLMNHPVQYLVPGIRRLSTVDELETRVYYWDPALSGVDDPGFARHVTWNTDLHSGYDWWATHRPDRRLVVRELARQRPDVLLCFGWAGPIARLGIRFARRTGTPLLLFGDSNARTPTGPLRGAVREVRLRRLFRRATGAITTSSANKDFYLRYGMSPAHLHPGVLPVDVPALAAAAVAAAVTSPVPEDDQRTPIRLAYAGKFVADKAVGDLIDAVALLPRHAPIELWLIGDGPLRTVLEQRTVACGLTERVTFHGFRNTDEVPALLAAADVVVLPSHREPYGLAAVEGMVAGAVAVVSSATGAWGTGDVVEHNATGLVYPAGDVRALARCLHRLYDDPTLRRRLATAGQSRATGHGPDEFATTVADALRTVGSDALRTVASDALRTVAPDTSRAVAAPAR
jgi:glycosyltransferase involved in cell wall biosynthesis